MKSRSEARINMVGTVGIQACGVPSDGGVTT